MKNISIGSVGKASILVSEPQLASSMGSGNLRVLATPAMIALMENAACDCLENYLEGDETTVGTELNVKHISATPCGMNVTAEATLTEVNGREFVFTVKASDEAGIIGEGVHRRFLVFSEKFIAKTYAKSK